jgi:aspartate aminotransferase-like enzyme
MSATHETSVPANLPQSPLATNFRLPGPTHVPPEVAAAGSWPMVNHRGPEFAAIVRRVLERLPYFFQTKNDVQVFPGSGSAGWEASIANCFSAGDKVAVISIGNFGERFALVAKCFGLDVTKIEFPWGQAADPTVVAEKLREMKDLRGVFLTHNETSTGVTNDLPALSKAIHEAAPDALIAVDAVSSMGCISVPVDELELDIVFTGSQKGWMCPPGLMMITAGPRALEAHKTAKLPRFYWDFTRNLSSYSTASPPYTPPVSLWYQLDVALALMMNETREGIFARHAQLGSYVRERIQAMGMNIFADLAHASNTVTAISVPEGKEVKSLLKAWREEDHIIFAGGQAHLNGKIFRIGHMGAVSKEDLDVALAAVERRMK